MLKQFRGGLVRSFLVCFALISLFAGVPGCGSPQEELSAAQFQELKNQMLALFSGGCACNNNCEWMGNPNGVRDCQDYFEPAVVTLTNPETNESMEVGVGCWCACKAYEPLCEWDNELVTWPFPADPPGNENGPGE